MSAPPGERLSRRRLLGLAGGAGIAAAVGFTVPILSRQDQTGKLLPSQIPLPRPFQVPLPVPPMLAPGRHPDFPGADFFEIRQLVTRQEILPGVPTEIWGYNGTFPGPTLTSRSGVRTVVRHHNNLNVPTVTHLHGGHTPPGSDGFPTDLLYPQTHPGLPMNAMPGMATMGKPDPQAHTTTGKRDYHYPMTQRAATLWYHDHRMNFTAQSVYRGLAGFHLVHDAEEARIPLPDADRDIPLMIADRSFAADGSLLYPALDPTTLTTPGTTDPYMGGVLGDVILVNGAPWPVLDVAAVRYRFRLLNASNARRYQLTLSPPPADGTAFIQIGSDGGLLANPVHHTTIDIAPAERFDVVIDFSRYTTGQEITLTNQLGSETTARVMRFRVARREADGSNVPDQLSTMEHIPVSQAQQTRSFSFQNHDRRTWTINSKEFDPTHPIATPRLDATEIWRFTTDLHHSIHLHLVQFQVIARNGKPPGAYDAGWKDTIDLKPAEEAAIIARFTDYPGRYVMHCHNLEHEDMAMMTTFTVT
ncbi:multicopper oxidase family protein [Rugosimonospora africana]|uniref:Multicopper oxidase CueO n=1 Tax=Rugosimonospora africana TaxID=556532 RepID=A0A8J3VRC7_9ACTN|nr:multicopper oxidase domain-containing protein [Rugosimonospora africana]GIH15972.1 spore coat protein A [Rugosimonospora africana]